MPAFPVRDHKYYARTRSICPECGAVIDAKLVEMDGKAYLDKYCPQHGQMLHLVSSSFEHYAQSRQILINGRVPQHFATEVNQGCPSDCGYCPQHEQHACTGLIEITERCNMACPSCYANNDGSGDISMADYLRRLDALEREEGTIDVLQISGGEPTLHPDLFGFLEEGRKRKPNRIVLNTNGRRAANDPEFVNQLAAFRDVLDIYLQYDGPSAEAAIAIRGSDTREEKERAVQNLTAAGIKVILVPTVCPENLDDMPAILEYAVRTPGVTGVTFQAMSYCGRNKGKSAEGRVTAPDIMAALARLPWLEESDLFPLPCSHPCCTQIAFLHCRPGKKPFPLIRLISPGENIQVVKNRLSFGSDVFGALLPKIRCISFKKGLKFSNILPALALRRFFKKASGTEWNREKLLRIIVKQFMDAETFDASRAVRCCIGIVTADERIMPFCSYNTVHREKDRVSRV